MIVSIDGIIVIVLRNRTRRETRGRSSCRRGQSVCVESQRARRRVTVAADQQRHQAQLQPCSRLCSGSRLSRSIVRKHPVLLIPFPSQLLLSNMWPIDCRPHARPSRHTTAATAAPLLPKRQQQHGQNDTFTVTSQSKSQSRKPLCRCGFTPSNSRLTRLAGRCYSVRPFLFVWLRFCH